MRTTALFLTVALLGGCHKGPDSEARGARFGGLGPAVTTPIADVTATVFVLDLSLPPGLSRADADAADTRALQREAAELALEVTETKVRLGLVEKTSWGRRTMTLTEEGYRGLARRGARVAPGSEVRRSTTRRTGADGVPVETHSYTVVVESPGGRYEAVGQPRAEVARFWGQLLETQRAALATLPPPDVLPAGPLEVRERWRYVAVSPPVPQLEERGFHIPRDDGRGCRQCADEARKRHAVHLSSFGTPGVDPATLTAGTLDAGTEIASAEFVFGGADRADVVRIERTSAGRFTLRRMASCPARVVRVEDSLVIDKGAGVIADPRREKRTWHELRGECVRDREQTHETFGPSRPLPPDAKRPARARIEQHRAELARLERGELDPALP